MLVNYTEVAVKKALEELLEEYKKKHPAICTCEKCKEDMLAMALNRLPPRYASTEQGELISKVSYELLGGKAEVCATVFHAICQVSLNPRHSEE